MASLLSALLGLAPSARAGHPIFVQLVAEALETEPPTAGLAALRCALPIPASAELLDPDHLVVVGAEAQQVRVLARGAGGAIRWVGIDALVELPASLRRTSLYLTTGSGAPRFAPLAVPGTSHGAEVGFLVDTGARRWSISGAASGPASLAPTGVDGGELAHPLRFGISFDVANDGTVVPLVVEADWRHDLDENGAVRAVVRSRGSVRVTRDVRLEVTVRHTFLRASAGVGLDVVVRRLTRGAQDADPRIAVTWGPLPVVTPTATDDGREGARSDPARLRLGSSSSAWWHRGGALDGGVLAAIDAGPGGADPSADGPLPPVLAARGLPAAPGWFRVAAADMEEDRLRRLLAAADPSRGFAQRLEALGAAALGGLEAEPSVGSETWTEALATWYALTGEPLALDALALDDDVASLRRAIGSVIGGQAGTAPRSERGPQSADRGSPTAPPSAGRWWLALAVVVAAACVLRRARGTRGDPLAASGRAWRAQP